MPLLLPPLLRPLLLVGPTPALLLLPLLLPLPPLPQPPPYVGTLEVCRGDLEISLRGAYQKSRQGEGQKSNFLGKSRQKLGKVAKNLGKSPKLGKIAKNWGKSPKMWGKIPQFCKNFGRLRRPRGDRPADRPSPWLGRQGGSDLDPSGGMSYYLGLSVPMYDLHTFPPKFAANYKY